MHCWLPREVCQRQHTHVHTRQCHWTVLPPQFRRNSTPVQTDDLLCIFLGWLVKCSSLQLSHSAFLQMPAYFSQLFFPSTGILIGMNEWMRTVMKEIHSIKENPEIQLLIGHPGFTSFSSWLVLAHLDNANDLFLGWPS